VEEAPQLTSREVWVAFEILIVPGLLGGVLSTLPLYITMSSKYITPPVPSCLVSIAPAKFVKEKLALVNVTFSHVFALDTAEYVPDSKSVVVPFPTPD